MRDLFIGAAAENAAKHLAFARREGTRPFRIAVVKFFEDDIGLVPLDQEPLFENPDSSFQLTVVMNDLGDGAN